MPNTLDRWLKERNTNLPAGKRSKPTEVEDAPANKRVRISLSNADDVARAFAEEQRAAEAARRAKAAAQRKRVGVLAQLPSLPLDVMFEVSRLRDGGEAGFTMPWPSDF
jgi:hypothetical protein